MARRRRLPAAAVALANTVAARVAGETIKRTAGQIARRVTSRAGVAALAGGAAAGTGYAGYRAHQRSKTAGVKRLRSGAPVAQRSSTITNKSNGEISSVKFRQGRKTAISRKQMEKLTIARKITRFQNIAPHDKGVDRGAMWLASTWAADTIVTPVWVGYPNMFVDNVCTPGAKNLFRAPCHFYLLNSTTLTDATQNGPAYQLFLDKTTGSPNFSTMFGAKYNGTTGERVWQPEWQNFGDAPNQKYIRQEWYDIRLGLRNAIKQTTYFDILVFQVKEHWLDPLETPSGVEEIKDRKAFYAGLAAPGVNHPIVDKGVGAVLRKMRVIRKLRIVMDKQATTEQDQSPDLKVVKLFIRDGRLYNYQYATAPLNPVDTYVVPNNTWTPQGAANVINDEKPSTKARTWLMIRAYDPTVSATAGGGDDGEDTWTGDGMLNSLSTPSYDILIRKCESARI